MSKGEVSELNEWEEKNISGYDILRLPGCPHSLPKARSLTQARDDYYHLLPNLIHWYETEYLKTKQK